MTLGRKLIKIAISRCNFIFILSHLYSLLSIAICLALGHLTFALVSLIPASLYGMFYFAIALHIGVIKPDKVTATINWIIKHMGVCFVPAGVGIMNYFDLIKASGWQLLVLTVATSIMLMIIVGLFYQKIQTRRDND